MGNSKFFIGEATKLLRPGGLDTMILYVTSRCNAKCNFCFYGDELNHVPELDLKDIVTVAKKLKNLRGLLIAGGEPFLRTDLFDIISAFVEHCGTKIVQIPTNGFFTDRVEKFVQQVTETYPDLNLSIQVSLDAIGEKHNEVRELKNCFERAEKTIAAIKSLQRQDATARVLVVSVLTPETIPTAKELALYVREKIDPDYHWFEPVRDMPEMVDNAIFTDDLLNFLHDNLQYYCKKISGASSHAYATTILNNMITTYSLNNFQIAYDNFTSKKLWPVKCIAGTKMAVLYPDGELAACELRKERVNIRNYDFDVNNAIKDSVFDPVQTDIKAHACDCTHGCFIPTSVRYSPAELLRLLWKSSFK